MANYLNVFAGFLTFIGASAIVYALWNPVMDFINGFPVELFVVVGSVWVMMCFWSIVYMPFMMMVSDDRGE